jgi:aspartate aminotransferase
MIIDNEKFLAERVSGLSESMTMAIDNQAREMIAAGKDVLKWTAGEPDFGVDQKVADAMTQAILKGKTKYTAATGMPELKDAIVLDFKNNFGLKYNTSQIVVTNGGKEALFLSLMATVNPGDNVGMISPYWTSYPEMIKLLGGGPCFLDVADIKNIENWLENHKPKVIILNSPNNPTGKVFSEEEMKIIISALEKHKVMLISDEIYAMLTYEGVSHFSPAKLSQKLYERTLVVNGVSKSDAMQGLRIGYVAGPQEIISKIAKIKSQTSGCPNSISQIGTAAALLSDSDYRQKMKASYEERWQKHVLPFAQKMKLNYFEPQAAFYFFFEIPKKYNGESLKFCDQLLKDQGLAITPGEAFGYPGWVRLCFAVPKTEIKDGFDRLSRFLHTK